MHRSSLPPTPVTARLLGWAGVLPFAVCAVALWVPAASVWETELFRALAAYAAVILSFLGGVRWGAAIAAEGTEGVDTDLVLAVIPSLIAWCALLLPVGVQPLYALVIAYALFGGLDVREAARGLWPGWYSRLRLQLTAAVLACLVAGALART